VPLLGGWRAAADSLMGKVECTRPFSAVLSDKHIRPKATSRFGERLRPDPSGGDYKGLALFGASMGTVQLNTEPTVP